MALRLRVEAPCDVGCYLQHVLAYWPNDWIKAIHTYKACVEIKGSCDDTRKDNPRCMHALGMLLAL